MVKKFIDSIPLNRLLIYLLVIGSLPPIFALIHYQQQFKVWDHVSDQIWNIHNLSITAARKQTLNRSVRNIYGDPDPYYIENQIESLTFLKEEKESLDLLFKNPSFTGNEAAEKRFAFLNSNANRIKWIHGNGHTGEGIQENEMILSHSVEIDARDLKEIIARIEGIRKGKPQLLVTDFNLRKKEFHGGNEVFELNMKVLKREFNP